MKEKHHDIESDEQLVVSGLLATERRLLRGQRIITLMSDEIDTASASQLVEDILLLISENENSITIIISSPGGKLEPGLAIIRAIRLAQKQGIKVIGQVFGQASSMAFFILQACDERVMGEGCWLMAHGYFTEQQGSQEARENYDKFLNSSKVFLSRLVSDRNTSKDDKYRGMGYWTDLMRKDTPNYISSKEALEMGLIDKIER